MLTLPYFCQQQPSQISEQKVKLEKSSHIWHHTRNSTRHALYNYLFISIFWQKEVESRALTECKNMIFIIITIAESERWLSLLSLCKDSFDCKSFFCIQFRASVWDFFFGCVDVKISSEFNLPILYDSVSLEYSLFLLLWMKLDVMISQLVISNLISTRSFEGRKKYCLDFFL